MLKALLKIGITSRTSKAEQEHHSFLIIMTLLMNLGAICWTVFVHVISLDQFSIFPVIYIAISALNLFFFFLLKKFELFRFIQVVISMLLPFILQWYMGGFEASGMMMIWAVISLTGAMTYQKMVSFTWLAVFISLILISGVFDRDFIQNTIIAEPSIRTILFAFNISLLSIIVFILFFGTKSKLEYAINKSEKRRLEIIRNKSDLMLSNNALLSSEEELRQNTEELQSTNEHLGKTIKELKDAQSQLLQAEKMSSLGVMTAGIAHEINNPINFVYSGVQSLRQIISDLIMFAKEAETLLSIEDTQLLKEKIDALQKLKEEINLQEVTTDTLGLLSDIENGADRVVEIVKGMKDFSRANTGKFTPVDIHQGIDSTLVILRSKLKSVKLEKNYDMSIMEIDAYSGELNQVFMNLIANGIDAMESKGYMIISTHNLGDAVKICVKDSGVGIPEEVVKKIFDPFFTTKPIGKGTGLGLSISYNIIEKHQGELLVDSEEGVGTEFVIILPKSQSK